MADDNDNDLGEARDTFTDAKSDLEGEIDKTRDKADALDEDADAAESEMAP
jgi:hypothetical protein